jgi:hypothetical protein
MLSLRMTSLFMLALITYGIGAPANFNPIDAVTSASTRLTIKSGQAYADSAQITWWDFYSNGDQQLLKYGTTTAFSATIDLQPFTAKTDITTSIPNLQPNTTYYYQFYRFYDGLEHMTDGSFTTFGNGSIRYTKPNAALAADLRNKTVEVYLPSGKLVASTRKMSAQAKISSGYGLLRDLDLKCGSYFLTVKDSKTGRIISRSKQAFVR